ncbi:MAG: glycosyltransferase [Acidobacteria bacterium]|nr:glycosyltransferase [Acidobacteriota bacterium]
MKICLITAFPPSRGGLSEYGYHIAQELKQDPMLSLTVLADVVPGVAEKEEDDAVIRCWEFNNRKSIGNILRMIRQIDPDVVWFNLLFTTFGHDPVAALRGMILPLQARLAGHYTHVTLHHLMDFIDLENSGIRFPALYRIGGRLATKILLRSNSLSVLMPAYRSLLQKKYGGDNVHFRTHGILAKSPEYPDFARRGSSTQNILTFGKWGTYKRLEPMIEAFQSIADRHPKTKLIIAGGDHPRTPGYVASLARKYEGPRIEFTGYVPEERIADLFRNASLAVLPYSSATGASGVAHLACAYGVPILSSDVPDFAHMAAEEDMSIAFYRTGDTRDLADQLERLLQSPERLRHMALQNFSAALRMSMPRVIDDYLRLFHFARQTRGLRPIRRLRRLPRWISRSFVGRLLLRWWKRNHRAQFFPGTRGQRSLNLESDLRADLLAAGSGDHAQNVVLAASEMGRGPIPARAKKNGRTHQHSQPQGTAQPHPLYWGESEKCAESNREPARIEGPLASPFAEPTD